LGENTNNVAELTSLLRGLQIAVQHQYHWLIIEGDSQVIIQLISKILHGKPLGGFPLAGDSPGSWRTLGEFIHPNLTLIPSHIKREANKVADHWPTQELIQRQISSTGRPTFLKRRPSLHMQRPC
jgi:ribonuclease HI